MKHKELLNLVVDALSKFDESTQGVQEYIKEYIGNQKNITDDECIFIQEVFSGCVQYNLAIMVVVDGYFHSERNKKTCLLKEKYLYKALVYLTLYRLDELEASQYRKFILSQNINRMHNFLSYFIDENNLKTWIFAEWCKAYDHSYVHIHLLSPLLRWLPELSELLQSLRDKVNNKQKPREVRSPTAVKPFNLTKIKPRSVPIPEMIPKLKKTLPVPDSTYQQPKELFELNAVKEKNRIRAEKQLMKASINQFECANIEKSDKTKERMETYKNEKEAKLKFNMSKARPLPSHLKDGSPIRLNAATIMREGLLIHKKEKEEQRKIADLATGGRDASEFLTWQKTMREKDLEKQLADIEAKRLDGKLSYEEAILARQSLIEENKQKVQDIKKETKELMDMYLKEKFHQEKEMRALVEQIMEGHENAKESQLKLKRYKQSIVAEVNSESKELMRTALEEAEEEMREKVALIAKIRAIESVPRIRFKLVDFTETSGVGLLGEMSVAELRERLQLLRIEEKKEEEKKRRSIIQNKMDKDKYLMETLESIAKHRSEKERDTARKLQAKRSASQREIRDPKVLELQERLSARRAERERCRIQTSPTKPTTYKMNEVRNQKKILEEQRWKELEKSREKAAKLHSQTLRQMSSKRNLVEN